MAGVREDDDFVADINVTPFVDVMLVLLVIFMVTAPMMTEGLDVELPQVQAAEVLPTEDDHMILSIKNDGALFLDECPTTLDDLDSVLKHAVALPEKQLFLRADKHVPYGAVMEVMGRIAEGDQRAQKVLDAMCYNIAKQIGAMAASLSGRVDGILLTGGIAYNEPVTDYLRDRCGFIAPVTVYPGENELEALVANALVVLRGSVEPKVYA